MARRRAIRAGAPADPVTSVLPDRAAPRSEARCHDAAGAGAPLPNGVLAVATDAPDPVTAPISERAGEAVVVRSEGARFQPLGSGTASPPPA